MEYYRYSDDEEEEEFDIPKLKRKIVLLIRQVLKGWNMWNIKVKAIEQREDIFHYLGSWIRFLYLTPVNKMNITPWLENQKENDFILTWTKIADLCGYEDIDEFNCIVLDFNNIKVDKKKQRRR